MDFIATPTFSRKRKKLLSEKDFALFIQTIGDTPDAGAVIVGTSGLRKIRFALPGRGKSGGVRIIYFWLVNRETVILLEIYSKAAKSDLTGAEEKYLAKLRDEIVRNLK